MNNQTIRCRWCQQQITLNPDSQEARLSGADPLRQMKRHLREECLKVNLLLHDFECGPVIDMMAFEKPNRTGTLAPDH
jgi:hypothetical protein